MPSINWCNDANDWGESDDVYNSDADNCNEQNGNIIKNDNRLAVEYRMKFVFVILSFPFEKAGFRTKMMKAILWKAIQFQLLETFKWMIRMPIAELKVKWNKNFFFFIVFFQFWDYRLSNKILTHLPHRWCHRSNSFTKCIGWNRRRRIRTGFNRYSIGSTKRSNCTVKTNNCCSYWSIENRLAKLFHCCGWRKGPEFKYICRPCSRIDGKISRPRRK